ncbi:hypothetical protein E2C01_053579 [Portunus trituberculatus]|uniref:Uncharacterized protein n=1 Tax=Portunus trituberculatus TaxID=210409 RepID=A0A5B7GSH2_PORTR|nr:hypothetical protein [Portunus trituberculatus]
MDARDEASPTAALPSGVKESKASRPIQTVSFPNKIRCRASLSVRLSDCPLVRRALGKQRQTSAHNPRETANIVNN